MINNFSEFLFEITMGNCLFIKLHIILHHY